MELIDGGKKMKDKSDPYFFGNKWSDDGFLINSNKFK
jgi:hypothetical protein